MECVPLLRVLHELQVKPTTHIGHGLTGAFNSAPASNAHLGLSAYRNRNASLVCWQLQTRTLMWSAVYGLSPALLHHRE
jgi:hypothetical protein